jgi:hypothetical protein
MNKQGIINGVLTLLQGGLGFAVLWTVYMIFARLDSDFGVDGWFGLMVIQPLQGCMLSALMLAVCFISGVPLHFNRSFKRWWKKHGYLSLVLFFARAAALVLSLLPTFAEEVNMKTARGAQIRKSAPTGGWRGGGEALKITFAPPGFNPVFIHLHCFCHTIHGSDGALPYKALCANRQPKACSNEAEKMYNPIITPACADLQSVRWPVGADFRLRASRRHWYRSVAKWRNLTKT